MPSWPTDWSDMRRGEVWWVDLDPSRSGEANKVRPCVVVSNDANNVIARRVELKNESVFVLAVNHAATVSN